MRAPLFPPRYSHRVRFPGESGKTISKWFTNKTAANAVAKKRRGEIGQEGLACGVLREDEKSTVQFWRGFMADVAEVAMKSTDGTAAEKPKARNRKKAWSFPCNSSPP